MNKNIFRAFHFHFPVSFSLCIPSYQFVAMHMMRQLRILLAWLGLTTTCMCKRCKAPSFLSSSMLSGIIQTGIVTIHLPWGSKQIEVRNTYMKYFGKLLDITCTLSKFYNTFFLLLFWINFYLLSNPVKEAFCRVKVYLSAHIHSLLSHKNSMFFCGCTYGFPLIGKKVQTCNLNTGNSTCLNQWT